MASREPPNDLPELLEWAAFKGDLPLVKLLVEEARNCQPTLRNPRNENVRHIWENFQQAPEAATRMGNLEVLRFLLDQGFLVTENVVQVAVLVRSTAALDLLLEYGWDINARFRAWKSPPISYAIRHDDLEPVQWFLANGASADVPHTFRTSSTPLSRAVHDASMPIITLLLSSGSRVDHGNLLSATCHSHMSSRLEVLELLLNKGAPVNAIDDWYNGPVTTQMSRWGLGTPLHAAVKRGEREVVEVLLRNGADKSIKDTKGRMPVHLARELENEELVEVLEGKKG